MPGDEQGNKRAYTKRGPLWLQDVQGLDVSSGGPNQLVVIVEILLGERRLPLPGAVYLDKLRWAYPYQHMADDPCQADIQ